MDYAVVLYFDESSHKKLFDLMREIAVDGSYMLEQKIPPHLTLCYFCSDDVQPIEKVLEKRVGKIACGEIFWASLGAFVPNNVLYAAPILNEYLCSLNAYLNSLIMPLANADEGRHYQPHKWQPHTTLATKLSHDELAAAFEKASHLFTPFRGTSAKLALAKCNPYREIKVWDLTLM